MLWLNHREVDVLTRRWTSAVEAHDQGQPEVGVAVPFGACGLTEAETGRVDRLEESHVLSRGGHDVEAERRIHFLLFFFCLGACSPWLKQKKATM